MSTPVFPRISPIARTAIGGVLGVLFIGASTLDAQPSARTAHAGNDSLYRHTSTDSSRARKLNELIITASRRPQRVADAAVTTELISRSDIVRTGAPDLYSALMQHVGIQGDNATVGSGGIQIQGMSSERVLVLVDGQPLIGRVDGQLDMSRIPTSIVERVEVVKGPLSTLYGSAAMGGVVNIITRSGAVGRPTVTASMIGGSRNRIDANVAVKGGTPTLHGLFGAGRRQIETQAGRADQFGARDRRWDSDGKLVWRANAALTLDAAALVAVEDQRWRGGTLYFFSDNDHVSGRVGATFARSPAHRVSSVLYASSFSHLSRRAAVPEPVSDSGGMSREQMLKADVVYNGQFGAHFLDAGVELKREALRTDRILEGRRTLYSTEPYAQFTLSLGAASIVPGIRVAHSTQWGSYASPKLAVLYRATPSVSLRGSVGMGYRAPEFKELYMEFLNTVGGFSYVVQGNPDLDPETSVNVSGGIEWNGVNTYARVQGFHNRFDKFIETALAGNDDGVEVYTYRNIDNGITRGVDVQTGTVVRGITFDASYSYLDAFQRRTQQPLLGRPKHSARAAADYELPWAVRTGVTLMYTGRTPVARDTVAGETSYRDAYTRTDVRLARVLMNGLDAQFGVQDILDQRPAGWPGITGRQWYVGLTFDRVF